MASVQAEVEVPVQADNGIFFVSEKEDAKDGGAKEDATDGSPLAEIATLPSYVLPTRIALRNGAWSMVGIVWIVSAFLLYFLPDMYLNAPAVLGNLVYYLGGIDFPNVVAVNYVHVQVIFGGPGWLCLALYPLKYFLCLISSMLVGMANVGVAVYIVLHCIALVLATKKDQRRCSAGAVVGMTVAFYYASIIGSFGITYLPRLMDGLPVMVRGLVPTVYAFLFFQIGYAQVMKRTFRCAGAGVSCELVSTTAIIYIAAKQCYVFHGVISAGFRVPEHPFVMGMLSLVSGMVFNLLDRTMAVAKVKWMLRGQKGQLSAEDELGLRWGFVADFLPVAAFFGVLVPFNLIGLVSTTYRFILDDPYVWILSSIYVLGALLNNFIVLAVQRRIYQARGHGSETWRQALARVWRPYGYLTPDLRQRKAEDRPEHAAPVLGSSARSLPRMFGLPAEQWLVSFVVVNILNSSWWSIESYFRMVPWNQ